MNLSRLIVPTVGIACLLAGEHSHGQALPKPSAGDAMIEKYLANDADQIGQRVFESTATREEWEAIRPRLKAELFQMLGLWPVPERTPLHATVTGTVEREGPVVIEKLHFQSRPGLYVTGNLYRPGDVQGKLPAILYVCGHSGRGRDGNKTAFQDHGMWFARNGYVVPAHRHAPARRDRRRAPRHLQPRPLVVAGARLHAGGGRVLERHPRHRLPADPARRRSGPDRRHGHLRRRGGDVLDCRRRRPRGRSPSPSAA